MSGIVLWKLENFKICYQEGKQFGFFYSLQENFCAFMSQTGAEDEASKYGARQWMWQVWISISYLYFGNL